MKFNKAHLGILCVFIGGTVPYFLGMPLITLVALAIACWSMLDAVKTVEQLAARRDALSRQLAEQNGTTPTTTTITP